MKEKELKRKGGEISVTEENKTEYVDLMVQWRLGRGIHEQTESFRKVLYRVYFRTLQLYECQNFLHNFLCFFTCKEVEIFVLLCTNCSECMWLTYSSLV